jgi:hypothetical protein
MEAWQVMPPELVTMALAFFMAGTQSGAVISVMRISPSWNWSICSGLRMTCAFPETRPGLPEALLQ